MFGLDDNSVAIETWAEALDWSSLGRTHLSFLRTYEYRLILQQKCDAFGEQEEVEPFDQVFTSEHYGKACSF